MLRAPLVGQGRSRGVFRPPRCGSPVAYGSLRAASRGTEKGKSHKFRRFWHRMIPCAELGTGRRAVVCRVPNTGGNCCLNACCPAAPI